MNEWGRLGLKLAEPLFSASRKTRNCIREWGVRTYAIVVAAEYADDFEIPGAEICDSWNSEGDSVIFVVRSKKELRGLSQIVKGIVGITRM
jgi:hypothetical protein